MITPFYLHKLNNEVLILISLVSISFKLYLLIINQILVRHDPSLTFLSQLGKTDLLVDCDLYVEN